MAPELLEGAISLNVVSFLRVDIYACGLVLWEILSRTQLTPQEIVGNFKLPLEEELGTSPTNESVQNAVVHKRVRPSFKPSWRSGPVSSKNLGMSRALVGTIDIQANLNQKQGNLTADNFMETD
jgi:hypothetical protein